MTIESITDAIPHRPPMLLLDRIVESDESALTAEKTFHADEFFFQGHYPDQPIVPGVILCEAGMQAGAVLLSQHVEGDGGVPVATRIDGVKFKKMVSPGDTISIAVTLKERLADAFFLTAKITCDGKLATRFEFACTIANKP